MRSRVHNELLMRYHDVLVVFLSFLSSSIIVSVSALYSSSLKTLRLCSLDNCLYSFERSLINLLGQLRVDGTDVALTERTMRWH